MDYSEEKKDMSLLTFLSITHHLLIKRFLLSFTPITTNHRRYNDLGTVVLHHRMGIHVIDSETALWRRVEMSGPVETSGYQ